MREADAQNENIVVFPQGINNEVGAYRVHANRGTDLKAQMGRAWVLSKKDERGKKL